MKNKAAFTLIELMITVIIIGIVSAFGIPNYSKMIARAEEKDAIYNLNLIREAVKLHMVREETAPPALADVDAINTALTINVMEQGDITYNCVVSNIYTCFGTHTTGWQVRFRLDTSDGDVDCSIATCPTL